MRIKNTSIRVRLSVLLFMTALMVPLVCALSSAEDSIMILSSFAEEEEGETPDVKEDTEVKIASHLEEEDADEYMHLCSASFGYLPYSSTPYFMVIIPPPEQV